MFGWRRRNDGFEWREYVRTTIKLRREDRARKIEEIKQAAASGAMDAGRQSVSAGRNGVSALGRWVVNCVKWSWALLLSSLRRGGAAIGSAISAVGRGVGEARSDGSRLPAVRIPARVKIAVMFGGLGVIAGLSAFLQYQQSGSDWSALLAGLVAVVLLGLAIAPWLRRLVESVTRGIRNVAGAISLPQLGWPSSVAPSSLKWVGVTAAVVLAVGAGFWAWQSGGLAAATQSVMSALPSLSTVKSVEAVPDIKGRGRAVTGDTIRIKRRMVRLAGIEAPEISQVCRDKRRWVWRCGQRARKMLARIIRRRDIICKNVSRIAGGRYQASCAVGDMDVAGKVVEKGYAFAQGVVFKTYSSAEDKARKAQRGIWQGETERPADFRAKRWEVASKSAPDGCPIKGRVVRKAKIYVLPWALDYRQVRVRRRRGERWFCSEDEATNAGFKPSSTG